MNKKLQIGIISIIVLVGAYFLYFYKQPVTPQDLSLPVATSTPVSSTISTSNVSSPTSTQGTLPDTGFAPQE
jgi:hypothetical protein